MHQAHASLHIAIMESHLARKDVAQLLLDQEVVAGGEGALLQAAVPRTQRHPQRVWGCLELQVYLERLRHTHMGQ